MSKLTKAQDDLLSWLFVTGQERICAGSELRTARKLEQMMLVKRVRPRTFRITPTGRLALSEQS